LPGVLKQHGGLLYEFNQEPAFSSPGHTRATPISDYFFEGDLAATLPLFGRSILEPSKRVQKRVTGNLE
jgi:hypothetical protein